MEFTLFLVRHGETNHNKRSVIQGQLDIPLSEAGIAQAKQLANSIGNIKWREVWSSDLKRAWQTANLALHKPSAKAQSEEDLLSHPLPSVHTDARMRERNYGTAQGKSLSHLRDLASRAGVPVNNFVPPEAESQSDVRSRGISFFKDLCARQLSPRDPETSPAATSILVVGHGGWLRELMTYLVTANHDASSPASFDREMVKTAMRICPNTAVSQFHIRLSKSGAISQIQCLSLHDRSHLGNSACSTEELAV